MNIPHTRAENLVTGKFPALQSWRLLGVPWSVWMIAVFLASTLFTALFLTIKHTQATGDRVLIAHTENLTQVILAQIEYQARSRLLDDDPEGLLMLAKHLQAQEGILEVSVQDNLGRSLVRVGHDLGISDYLLSLSSDVWAVTRVIQIVNQDEGEMQLLGFVRVTFDYGQITAQARPFYRALWQPLFMLVSVAFATGGFLMFWWLRRFNGQRVHPKPPEHA